MAFSTIQGSGGAPDSFVGTSGVDTISLINSTGNFFLGAQEADDTVTFVGTFLEAGVISNATLKGGQGNDTFSDTANINVFNGVWHNGNGGADTLTFTNGLLSGSTIHGGQGGDSIVVGGGTTATLVNGNRDADTLTIQGAAASSSSFLGGQGSDIINVNANATGSTISGDNDNDSILIGRAGITLTASSLLGGQGNDTINGNTNATLSFIADGGDGTDTIGGGTAADTLSGGAGNDTIATTAGNDLVTGGLGFDSITLAAGVDTIVYGGTAEGGDTVAAFTAGANNDVVRLLVAGFAGAPAAGTAAVVTGTGGVGTPNLTAANNNGQTVVVDTAANLAFILAGTTNRRFFVDTTAGRFMYDADGDFTTAADRVTLFTSTAALGGLVAGNINFA